MKPSSADTAEQGVLVLAELEKFLASDEPIVVGFRPGTTIDIKLRTDRIEVLPDELEELEW